MPNGDFPLIGSWIYFLNPRFNQKVPPYASDTEIHVEIFNPNFQFVMKQVAYMYMHPLITRGTPKLEKSRTHQLSTLWHAPTQKSVLDPLQELQNRTGNVFSVTLNRKVTGINEFNLRLRQIPLERLGFRGDEDGIILAPNRQQRTWDVRK
jgi:hypothetical protein